MPRNLEGQGLTDTDELAVDEDVALIHVLDILGGERRGLDVGLVPVHRGLVLNGIRAVLGDLDVKGDNDVLAGSEIAQIPGEGGTGCRGALDHGLGGLAVHEGASYLVLQTLTELVDDRRLRVGAVGGEGGTGCRGALDHGLGGLAVHEGASYLVLQTLTELVDDRRLRVGAVGVMELDLVGQDRLTGLDLVGMRRLGLAGNERLGGIGGHLVVADLDGGLVLDDRARRRPSPSRWRRRCYGT